MAYLSFRLVLVFNMPSSLSLIISKFWLKVRDVWFFLSFGTLEAIVGVKNLCNFNIVERKNITGHGGIKKHTIYHYACCLIWNGLWFPKIITKITITSIILMNMFKILQELLYDTEIDVSKYYWKYSANGHWITTNHHFVKKQHSICEA